MPLGTHQVSYPLSTKGFFLMEKQPQEEADNSHLANAEVKNV